MPGNFRKEDLRIIKTYRALLSSMLMLLEQRNFAKITTNDICEDALISRSTFYCHFRDKYDLLRYWLSSLETELTQDAHEQENFFNSINGLISNNSKKITNLLQGADGEILDLMLSFMYDIMDSAFDDKGDSGTNNIIFSSFCSGGLLNLLLWQVQNKFPMDSQFMNPYLYGLLENIWNWNSNQEAIDGGYSI